MFGTEFILDQLMVTLIIGILTVFLLYWYATQNHDFWKKRGVPYVKPVPLFGSLLENMKRPLYEIQTERYSRLGRVYGFFDASQPKISVGDPALLRDIMVKDFSFFTGRRKSVTGHKVLDNKISMLRGDDWKRIRSIVTPTFTTGKIKRMLGIFNDCSETLVNNFKKAVEKGESIDARRLYGAFSMDVIASSAFSTKIDSHNDPDNKFVRNARNMFGDKRGIRFIIFLLFPRLLRLFRIKFFYTESNNFFRDITLQIVEERRRTGQVRNDFLQLLMDTTKEVSEEQKWDASDKEKGDIASNYGEHDAGHQMFKTTPTKSLSMDELVSQCEIFFLAGYVTTASTLSFATYLLALHPDIQHRLRAEVDKALAENDGELKYETVQNMKYLDNVISETLRLFPPSIRLERYADADYKLGDTGITIPKGMTVYVPTYSMHRDPKNFPDPDRFDPDRFTSEARAKRDPYTYLPFGAGPRNCVGMRFALVEIKVCLSQVIANFKINRSPQAKDKLEFNVGQLGLLQPKEVLVQLEIRKDSPLVN